MKDEQRDKLEAFFNSALAYNKDRRNYDLQVLVQFLDPNKFQWTINCAPVSREIKAECMSTEIHGSPPNQLSAE